MMATIKKPITVFENDPGIKVKLDGRGQTLLRQHNQIWKRNLGLNRDPFVYEDCRLSVRDVTGFVDLGSLVVEVAPKFLSPLGEMDGKWRRSLWAILARVYQAPVLGPVTPGEVTAPDQLPDLLGWILLNSLRASKPNGRPMGYITDRGSLNHLQGRLDTGRIMDVLVYPGQIPCEYDVYSENVPTNRLLRWAAEQLSTRVRSISLSHYLAEEALAITTASSVPPSLTEAERIGLAPHHALLQPAVTVGQLLLLGRGLQHGAGNQEMPGFLWKSAEVFERFVWYLTRTVVRTRMAGIRVAREQIRLGEPFGEHQQPLSTMPDIRLEGIGRTIGVLDAKYKVWGTHPDARDTYQVVTGAWTRNCAVAALVYPSPSAISKDPLQWRLLGPGNPVNLWALFVNLTEMGEPFGERVLIERLANDLATIIS